MTKIRELRLSPAQANGMTRGLNLAQYTQEKYSGGKKRGKIPTSFGFGPFERTTDKTGYRVEGKGWQGRELDSEN